MRKASVLLLALACASGQKSRDEYREAYRAWRQADPGLEREAGSLTGDAAAQRADRLAAEAAKCGAARKAFLERLAEEGAQQVLWIQNAPAAGPQAPLSEGVLGIVAAENATVARTIQTFATDPDSGIQQVRQALEKERAALTALKSAIDHTLKAAEAATNSAAAAEQARSKVIDESRALVTGFKDAAGRAGSETAAWMEYYRRFSGDARGGSNVPAGTAPLATVQPNMPAIMNPAPRTASITPLPLARYVGAWNYPPTNGLFHGAQPEFVELIVNEDNGRVAGTLFARFKLPPGSTSDPVVRFDFSGILQNTRNQVFNLSTSDGARGTIELIPGPAFNLLEVNFQADSKPEKIRQGDVVLLKK